MHNNSVYCAKPDNTVDNETGLFQRASYDFADEASALGAAVTATASGFQEVVPFINSPEQLSRVPRLSESAQMENSLARIRELSGKQPFMANAIAPYSLLSMIASRKLMAWLLRYPDETRSALLFLASELGWYISGLFAAGAKVVSLSDPHAQRELVGDSRFREFCVNSQMDLLKQIIKTNIKGVLHLCPYCFTPLEEYGLISVSENRTVNETYEYALLTAAENAKETVLIGRQCPHTKQTDTIYYLSIKEEHKYG
jgi:uroporphyrinogen-III decarboxylase